MAIYPYKLTEEEFREHYIPKAREISPSQPESWYIRWSRLNHSNYIKRAIAAGKTVPLKVRKQYPELFPVDEKVKVGEMKTKMSVPTNNERPMSTLEKRYLKAMDSYHNGTPIMTDAQFDKLQDDIRAKFPDSPILKQIGAPVKGLTRHKVELPYHMGSLDKVKADSVGEWLKQNPGPYCVSDKLDGLSLLAYQGFTALYTRGDGRIGQDVSHVIPYLKIPAKLPKRLAVRNEIIMSRANFAKFNEEFENARNMVGGMINPARKTAHVGLHSIDVVSYELLNPRMTPSEGFEYLKSLGLKVAPYKVFQTLTVSQLSKMLAARKAKSPYDIDGLVIVLDKKQPLNTEGNPVSARAFKEVQDDDIAEVKVVAVHWQASRHGLMKPRVEIEPTRLSGVTVQFATGFNAKFIQDNGVGRNSIVRITRSGDVIPHIMAVLKKVRPILPTGCHWVGTDLVMDDTSEDGTVLAKQITNFFTTLGAEFVSIGTIQRLIDGGYDSVPKILKITKPKLLAIEGIQDRSADRILTSIKTSIQDVGLPTLMDASGMFGRLLGTKKLTSLVLAMPNVLMMSEMLDAGDISSIPGWSAASANQFMEGLPKFKKFLKACPSIDWVLPIAKKVIRGKLTGQTFVFTGVRDASLKADLEAKGATVSDSMTNATTVIAKDPNGNSSKLNAARARGVKIISLDAARKLK